MSDAAAREQTNTEVGADEPGLRVPFSVRATPPPAAHRRLGTVVVAKLALDLLFVCGLALYTYADTFRNTFNGSLEHADARSVRGWVVDESRPGVLVVVQLFVDGRFVAAVLADKPGPDAPGDGTRRGFAFEFDPPLDGEHEARVYAVRESRGGSRLTLQQVGAPRAFASR